ncbi:MAG: MTAP family purine nucleoside phosphorylase, partial [Gammaproteobacteria bacterium]|nr:MTAP family purine nucleoside phosphorylase [Gammaproteobacteria bacterium]
MTDVAIIGGHGITAAGLLSEVAEESADTPFGPPSGLLQRGRAPSGEVVFMSRHGPGNKVPPHRINYRANVQALRQLGVERVIATAAVGGITPAMAPGAIVIPDQIIDYTTGRDSTFFDGEYADAHYVDFTEPFDASVRRLLCEAAAEAGV